MGASDNQLHKTVVIALIFLLAFSLKYVFFIQNHSLENSEGDDKTFIVYGDKIAKGQLTEADKTEIYNHIQKPVLMFIPAVLVKLGLLQYYLLVPFVFDMLLFAVVYWALNERTGNFLIAAGGSILASWNSLLGYYSFQYLPEMPFASSIIAFTYFFDKFLETRKNSYKILSAVFFAVTTLFRLESVIVLLVVAAAYVLKNQDYLRLRFNREKNTLEAYRPTPREDALLKDIGIAAGIGLLIIACYFMAYIYWIEGSIGPGDILKTLQRFQKTQELVLVEQSTESKGVFFFLPYMLLLAFTPLSCALALIGMICAFRRRGLFDTYLLTFLVLLLERWVIFYIGKGAQKYLTCFFPFLAVFAGLGAYWLVKAVGAKGKLNWIAEYAITAVVMAFSIYSSYAWIHQPIPGQTDLGHRVNSILIASPLETAYLWDQSVGQINGYLLFRDSLREYRKINPGEYTTVYTNIDASHGWIKTTKALEQIDVRNITEYNNNEKSLFAVIVPSGVYIPPTLFQKDDGIGRKLVIMTPSEYNSYRFAFAPGVNPRAYIQRSA